MSNDIIIYDASTAMEQAKQKATIVKQLRSSKIMIEGKDYGTIPGTGRNGKPTLLKPGAERLCSAFGLSPRFIPTSRIERFEPDNPLFQYEFECVLTHIESGKEVARANGSCNSMESKYRWRWLWPNEVDGMDTTEMVTRKTKSGKTQYRATNDDIFSQVNTILKMAQKRALVAAVLIATNASEHFTQDIEDLPDFSNVIDVDFQEVKPASQSPKITEDTIKKFYNDFRTKIEGTSGLTDRAIFDMICEENSVNQYDIGWWNEQFKGDINAAKYELADAWEIHKAQQPKSSLDGLDPDFDAANPIEQTEQPQLMDEGDLDNNNYASGKGHYQDEIPQ